MTTTNDSPAMRDTPSFNLWLEGWLPLEMPDGSLKRHSLRDALLHAHERRTIYDPSPLVIVGVYRLLIAILQDALNPQANAELDDLWRTGHFSQEKITAFGETYADRFDLFSPDKPFLQSADLPMFPKTKEEIKDSSRKSISKLFAEIPSGDEVAHYRHENEDEVIFSPATAALGLLTIPAFASSGGSGNFPSINGAPPPLYVLPGGKSLFESLATGLLTHQELTANFSEDIPDVAWWRREVPVIVPETGKRKETTVGGKVSKARPRVKQLTVVGYLHGLLFPARKIRLQPELMDSICSRSGERTHWGIRKAVFRMGESLADDAAFWRDPFVAYKLDKKERATIKVLYGRAKLPAWREFSGLFMQNRKDASVERPRFLDQFSVLDIAQTFEKFPFRCIALHAKADAKIFEWLDLGFDVPPLLLRDPDGALWTDDALTFATNCAATITRVFAQVFRGSSKKAMRFNRLKANMEASFWQVMGEKFRRYVIDLGDEATRKARLDDWLDETKRQAQAAFERAAKATGDDGNSLRLIEEGKARCRIALVALRNKTNQPIDSQGVANDASKPAAKSKRKTAKRPRQRPRR